MLVFDFLSPTTKDFDKSIISSILRLTHRNERLGVLALRI